MTEPTLIDFSAYITDRTKDFVGREWVFAEIERWLAEPDAPRYFIITGEPGIGKTAIAARLTQIRELAAIHFCIARQADTIDPLTFTRSISHQLTQINGFAQGILKRCDIYLKAEQTIQQVHGQAVNVQIENLIINAPSPTVAFTNTIVQPLKALYDDGFDRQLVILVDALDEAVQLTGQESIVHLLASVRSVPAQVRFVLTSRPDSAVLHYFTRLEIPYLVLDAEREENLQDVREYVHRELEASERLQARVVAQKMRADVFVEQILEASHGNFLYLAWLLPAVAKGLQGFDQLSAMPAGLDGIYSEFLRTRAMSKDIERWREQYRPVLGVLAAAQEPLEFKHLAALSGVSPQKASDVLSDLAQFLNVKSVDGITKYRIYHASFVDFLTNLDRNPIYWIDPVHCHHRIAEYYIHRYSRRWLDCDLYGMRHLARHLAEAERWKDFHQLIGQPGMENHAWAQSRFSVEESYHGYLNNVNLAIGAARRAGPAAIGWQIRYALIRAGIKTVATNIPPSLLVAVLNYGLLSPLKALNYAEQSMAYKYQPWAFAAVAPHMDDGTCQRLIDNLPRGGYCGSYENSFILKTLFQSLLNREQVSDAVNLVGTFGSTAVWSVILVELAESLTESVRRQLSTRFIEAAGTGDRRSHSGALARWAAMLPFDERVEMLDTARLCLYRDAISPREDPPGDTLENDLVWFIKESIPWDPDIRMLQLLPFLSHLGSDSRKRVVKAAVDAANSNDQIHQRMGHLSRLLGYLDEPLRTEIENRTIYYWSDNLGTWSLGQILPLYVHSLSTQNRLYLLKLVMDYRRGTERALLLASFVPWLDDPERAKIIEEALACLYEVPDWMTAEDGLTAFDRLCPFLTRNQALYALEAVLKIKDKGDQCIASSAYGNEDGTQLQRAVQGAFGPPFCHIESQMRYWKSLRMFVNNQLWEHGARTGKWNWSDFYKGAGDERVGDYVARLENEDAEEVRKQFKKNRGASTGSLSRDQEIRLLAIYAARHQGKHRQALLRRAIGAAHRRGDPINSVRDLERILPLADNALSVPFIEEVLPGVAEYKWEDVSAVAAAGLLPYSDPSRCIERVRASLQRVFAHWPHTFRKVDFSTDQIVLAMTRFWCEFSDDELYGTWMEILDDISQLLRPDLLITLAALAPLVTQLGGAHVRQQVMEAIDDISHWWP